MAKYGEFQYSTRKYGLNPAKVAELCYNIMSYAIPSDMKIAYNIRHKLIKEVSFIYKITQRIMLYLTGLYYVYQNALKVVINKYNIIAHVTSDKVFKYDVRVLISQNTQLLYSLLRHVNNIVVSVYTIIGRYITDVGIVFKYDIRNLITSIPHYYGSFKYGQRKYGLTLPKIRVYYNVRKRVEDLYIIGRYRVIARVWQRLNFRYSIVPLIYKNISSGYHLLHSISTKAVIKYNIFMLAYNVVVGKYAHIARLIKTFTGKYDIRVLISEGFIIGYSIRSLVTALAETLKYNLLNLSANMVNLIYKIRPQWKPDDVYKDTQWRKDT